MKFVQIVTGCDMTRAGTGERVPADETVYLAIGPDPDRLEIRELDLTQEWAKQLREVLLPFLDASHEPGAIVTPGAGGNGTGKDKGKITAVQEFNRARVAWAQANGYKLTKRVAGGYYPPVKTQQAYAHHLASRDDLLTEEHGLQPDYDPVTGNAV